MVTISPILNLWEAIGSSTSADDGVAHWTFTAHLKLWGKSARLPTMGHRGGPMPDSHINDPQHWLERAKEPRAIADEMKHLDGRQRKLRIAKDYVRLAERAEARAKGLLQSTRATTRDGSGLAPSSGTHCRRPG